MACLNTNLNVSGSNPGLSIAIRVARCLLFQGKGVAWNEVILRGEHCFAKLVSSSVVPTLFSDATGRNRIIDTTTADNMQALFLALGGVGSRLKLRQGYAAHSFKMAPLLR